MTLAAGTLSVLLGLGFGLPCVFGIRHFAKTGEVWTFTWFPTYGDGPFERIGIPTGPSHQVQPRARRLGPGAPSHG